MDTLRGTFDPDATADRSWDASEEASAEPASRREAPPESIGQDERRMQVRAYNHWASLLGERMFPNIVDLNPASLPDFGPYSVLLDFSQGIDNPAVHFVGDRLARECSAGAVINRLSDVPPRSLLSRITDHYMQILANQAPIGFEAEFVNYAGVAILYRGILLPYSSDDETIDFIYGVINWKEMADQLTADELLLEIDQALELGSELELAAEAAPRPADPVTDWADSPATESDADELAPRYNDFAAEFGEPLADDYGHPAARVGGLSEDRGLDDGALPDFSRFGLHDDDEEYDEDEGDGDDDVGGYNFASLADYIEAPTKKAIDLAEFDAMPVAEEHPEDQDAPEYRFHDAFAYGPEIEPDSEPEIEPLPEPDIEPLPEPDIDPVPEPEIVPDSDPEPEAEPERIGAAEAALLTGDLSADAVADSGPDSGPGSGPDSGPDAELHECLASARELARAADSTEDRSRAALYAAVSRAYDVSLAAQAAPQEYAELIATSGLAVQDRAPMTPIVKLVFGHDYDKTRVTEYAAVLTHAHRLQLARGSLAGFLAEAEGGVKAVVKAERSLRREQQGKPAEDAAAVREALAQQLRALEAITLEELDGAGPEFALVLIRRDEIGCAEILAELPEDIALIERAGRKLFG